MAATVFNKQAFRVRDVRAPRSDGERWAAASPTERLAAALSHFCRAVMPVP